MVKTTADAFVEQGLDQLGYKWVTLDDCWSAKTRDAKGNLMPDPKQFPNGMAHVADYVHSRGLKFGVYTSAGDKTCKGDRPGSYGHYEADAKTLASWGVDFVKMDHCGLSAVGNATDRELYGNMSAALNATGRPILFSLCQWGGQDVETWGHDVAQMYRIQMDHLPLWDLPTKASGVGLGQGTLQIIEFMAQLQPAKWTRRWGWLDPDFLMTLYPLTMDFTASRTEYSFWALWSAPMLVATDVRYMSHDMRTILTNKEVIAINQDESATSAERLRNDTSGVHVWARPLANGDKAIILFNANLEGRLAVNASVAWAELGWPAGASVRVRDLWANEDLGARVGGFSAASLQPRDIKFLRLKLEVEELEARDSAES